MIFTLIQSVFHSMGCQRRAAGADDVGVRAPVDVSENSHIKLSARHIAAYEESRSTDTSGPEKVAESFDGSDSDDTDLMPRSDPSTGSATDGSDVESGDPERISKFVGGQMVWQQRNDLSSRLNPNATAFVPTTVPSEKQAPQSNVPLLRGSIRSLLAALDDWEASTAAEDFFASPQQDMAHDPTSVVLQQVISKLSPQDSAMIRAFVDAKIAQGVQSAMAGSSVAAELPSSAKMLQKEEHRPAKVVKGARLRRHRQQNAKDIEILR